uniref:Mannose receptor, C type 1b n=1 Tax=Anabas testudineus TaxID=64144 RepID=A0AAQ6IAX8_ANATE
MKRKKGTVSVVLRFPPSQCHAHKSSACNATGFCLVKRLTRCLDLRWTTSDRLFVTLSKKCLGVQGKTVGSEVTLYDCDEKSDLQKWECKNGTLLALKGQELYIEVKADETLALSKTVGPNNHLTITGTSSGACTKTYREYYTIEGNANGRICMFPFMYKDRWFGDCTTYDSSTKRPWCAIETKNEREQWGYCPTSSREHWARNLVTGAYYQLNTQSALTWSQAEKSCKQQGASLVSINDPNDQGYISGKVPPGGSVTVLKQIQEHGWQWSNGKPYRYLRWSTGHPLPNPGHNCAFLDTAEQYWQSSTCNKKMGYICYIDGAPPTPPQIEQGFCPSPWIPYNGHCFYLIRTSKTWSDAQKACRKEHGDLVSIRNVEDQSFVISQLGYGPSDELWIGLNDRKTEGLFDWSDQTTTVSFTSWESGNPDVLNDVEDCVLIRGENGNWADRSCNEKHGYICMKQSETESTGDEVNLDIGCVPNWKRHGSYCYFVGTDTKTFDEANDDCKSAKSYLADVSNGVDNAFLVSLVGLRPEKYFWLGLSNQKNLDEFVWTNTDQVRFTHWNAEMPGNQQGCVAMTTGILAGLWDLLPCTNKEKYICKHLAEGALITVPPPTQSPPQCAEGWNRVGTRNVCAKFFTGPRSEEKTWFEARDYCRAIGGDLLSIHILNVTLPWLQGRAWIGLHVPDPNIGYVWSDGSPLNFQHWQEGEPNNFNNDESCVEFRMHHYDMSGSWNDLNCESYNDWFCQIRAGVTPKPPPTDKPFNTTSDGWIEWRGNQYYIHRMSLAAENARHFCQQQHGDLVSLSTKDENVFLWKQVGFWRTCNCGQEHYSICKRRQAPTTNTTAAPTAPPKGGCPEGNNWKKFDSKVRNDLLFLTFRKCFNFNLFIYLLSTDPNTQPKADPTIPNIYVSLGNDSMKVVTENLTWDDAKKRCASEKANLASLRNEWTQAYAEILVIRLKAPLWIGLNKQQTDGYFRYIDGWHLNSASWAEGEPTSNQPCVYIDTEGKWRTAFCNQTMYSVCMQSTDVPPTESTSYQGVCPEETNVEYHQSYSWLPFKGYCYLFVTEEIEWADAASSCVRHGGILASIEDPSEQQFIKSYIEIFQDSYSSFWIGLYKTHKGTTFFALENIILKIYCIRVHTTLVVVLIIIITSTLIVVAFFFYKKSPRPLPTFDNPLYFDGQRSTPDVVDTNKMIENAEVENPEPIITL